MKSAEERQNYILDCLRKEGNINVETLAQQLGMSGATIRSDLRLLESRHQIQRYHGGASSVKLNVVDLPVGEKYKLNSLQKQRIGKMAASLLADGDSIIMTSGSTIESFAHAIKSKGSLNVVTPSIRVAVILSEKDGIDIMTLGGRLVRNSLSVRDHYTFYGLRNISAGKLFFSCDGFDIHSGITTAFPEEARLTMEMMAVSNQKILLADSSKLGMAGFGKICKITDIDIMITDSGISQSMKEKIEMLGIKVLVA